MTINLNPYLNFAGNAREAVQFYASVLGGEPQIFAFGDMGEPGEGVDPNGVMHASLATPDGFMLMASDAPPGQEVAPGGNVTVSISGTDAEKLRGFWAGLSDGGQVTVPLEKQFWGDEFGMVIDRFGIPWMVNIGAGEGA